jgi:hypothetical protein
MHSIPFQCKKPSPEIQLKLRACIEAIDRLIAKCLAYTLIGKDCSEVINAARLLAQLIESVERRAR